MNRFLRFIRIVATFYRSFFFASIVISSICISIFTQQGAAALPGLFWFKVATLGIIYFFVTAYLSKQFFYYRNLGISKFILWTTSFGIDLLLFIILMILVGRIL